MTKHWAALAVALSVVVCAADAAACHNGVEIRVVPVTQLVAQASQALEREQPERAVTLAGRAIRRIRSQRRSTRNRLLMNRGKRILAVATLRLDGAVDTERFAVARSMDATARREALRWALGILEYGFSEDRGPVSTAHYAEALARFESQRARARMLLRQLADADVMPDARGYRVLASLEDDAAAREVALAACRARAGRRAATLCALPAPGDG